MRPRVFIPVAAVAASTVLLGCHRGDSILLVEVAGDLRLQPASFVVAVASGSFSGCEDNRRSP